MKDLPSNEYCFDWLSDEKEEPTKLKLNRDDDLHYRFAIYFYEYAREFLRYKLRHRPNSLPEHDASKERNARTLASNIAIDLFGIKVNLNREECRMVQTPFRSLSKSRKERFRGIWSDKIASLLMASSEIRNLAFTLRPEAEDVLKSRSTIPAEDKSKWRSFHKQVQELNKEKWKRFEKAFFGLLAPGEQWVIAKINLGDSDRSLKRGFQEILDKARISHGIPSPSAIAGGRQLTPYLRKMGALRLIRHYRSKEVAKEQHTEFYEDPRSWENVQDIVNKQLEAIFGLEN